MSNKPNTRNPMSTGPKILHLVAISVHENGVLNIQCPKHADGRDDYQTAMEMMLVAMQQMVMRCTMVPREEELVKVVSNLGAADGRG